MGLSWSKFTRHHQSSQPPPPQQRQQQQQQEQRQQQQQQQEQRQQQQQEQPPRPLPSSSLLPLPPPAAPPLPPPPPPPAPVHSYNPYPYPAPPQPLPYAPAAPRPSIPHQFGAYGAHPPSSSRAYAPVPINCYPHAQPQPHYSQFLGYYGSGAWGPGGAVRPVAPAAPPPYVDHKTAKKVKNDVNVHKDTIKLSVDEQSSDSHLVSFTFDALVDGSISVLYFAKEEDNCTFSPIYPEMYAPRKIPFQKGVAQKFCQPSGSGIDLGFFDVDELSKPSQNEDVFPLVICAESSVSPNQPTTATSAHAQITLAVIEKNVGGDFRVRVIKQILWIEGVRYELREIYGISNAEDTAFEDTDPGKECVICMTEPKDTAVLPCRHMCVCSECAKELRLQSNKCPICREPIQQLIEIKVDKAPS